eukprot:879023-Prymnesium_polylepis.2
MREKTKQKRKEGACGITRSPTRRRRLGSASIRLRLARCAGRISLFEGLRDYPGKVAPGNWKKKVCLRVRPYSLCERTWVSGRDTDVRAETPCAACELSANMIVRISDTLAVSAQSESRRDRYRTPQPSGAF